MKSRKIIYNQSVSIDEQLKKIIYVYINNSLD